jgi:serine/threonine protein kinase
MSEKVASRPQADVEAVPTVRPSPAQDSLLNLQLDEYRLEATLGRGGMARIYRGLDVHLERHVAIKVIDTPFRADSDYTVRFEREAQAIAKLEHPHIVRLYRYGRDRDLLYIAMQYVDGADLKAILDSYQAGREYVEPEEASRIVRQICLALDYAHGQGVIHRDVKPSNIMLDGQGRVYLTDFGLALLTELGTRGEIFGSPHYIAPEQAISSANVVPQSDLYAVGVILYEMFTGQPPFDAQDPLDVAMLQMSEPPRPPRELRAEIGPELEEVILKALEKQPRDRYQSGAELADALDRALGITMGETRSPSQKTIAYLPSRERADRNGTSLPVPVPAAVAQPIQSAQEKTSAAAPASSAPARRRDPILIYAGLGLGACAIVTVLAVVAWLLTSGTAQSLLSRSTPTGTPTPIPVVAESATPVLPPLVTATPTRQSPTVAPPSVVPTSTATPAAEPTTSYEVLIAKRAEDGLFVINGTAQNLPLALLQLGDGAGRVDGADWGVSALSPGDCVVAWKDKGEPELPDKVQCNQVGNVLIRSKPDVFWEQLFYVYYGGETFGGCDKKAEECPVHISTGAGYTLHIAKRGEESLFVLNLSPRDFALAPLQLGDGTGQVSGADWGKPTLGNGECVTVWKDDGDPHPPERVMCKPIGEPLTRGKGDRFWKSTFDVYYDGSLIGTCEKDHKHCFVHIPGD